MTFNELGSQLIRLAPKHEVRDSAPSTEQGLYNAQGLIIWSGASTDTIWGDKRANWAFRALHDQLHLKTGLGFSVDHEIELGRRQANIMSQYSSLLGDLVFCEVAGQAMYYRETGKFVQDQQLFTKVWLSLNR